MQRDNLLDQFEQASPSGIHMTPDEARQIAEDVQKFVDEAVGDMDAAISLSYPDYLESLGLAQRWCNLIHKDDKPKISHARDVAVGMYRTLRYLGYRPDDSRLGLMIGLLHEIRMPGSMLTRDDAVIEDRFSRLALDVIQNITWDNAAGHTPQTYLSFMDGIGRPRGDHQTVMHEDADLWSWIFVSVHEQLAGLNMSEQLPPAQESARRLTVALMNERIRRRLVEKNEGFLTLDAYLQSSTPARHPHPSQTSPVPG